MRTNQKYGKFLHIFVMTLILVFISLHTTNLGASSKASSAKELSADDMQAAGDEKNIYLYNAFISGGHSANQADMEGGMALKGDSHIPLNGFFNYGASFSDPGNAVGSPLNDAQRIGLMINGQVYNYGMSDNARVGGYTVTNSDGYKWIDQQKVDVSQLFYLQEKQMQETFANMQKQQQATYNRLDNIVNKALATTSAGTVENFNAEWASPNLRPVPYYIYTESNGKKYVVINAESSMYNDVYDSKGYVQLPEVDGSPFNIDEFEQVIVYSKSPKIAILTDMDPALPNAKDFAAKTTYYVPNATQVTNVADSIRGGKGNVQLQLAPDINSTKECENVDLSKGVDANGNDCYKGFLNGIPGRVEANAAIIGSVLAPNATILLHGGSINGYVWAKNLHQRDGAELHNFFNPWLASEYGRLKILKVDEQNENIKIGGARFKLMKKDGTIIDNNLVSDVDGKIEVNGLVPGEYILVEIEAPNDYELDPTPHNFTISANSDNQVHTYTHKNKKNEVKLGKMMLKKFDAATQNLLKDAHFKLSLINEENNQESVVFKDASTNVNGELYLNDLVPGKYKLEEIKAPEGYQLNPKPEYFNVYENGTTSIDFIKFANLQKPKPTKGTFKLFKYVSDADNIKIPLSNAQFSLYQIKNNQEVLIQDNLYSNASGYVSSSLNVPGEYVLVETKAPAGFELNNKKIKFTIQEQQTTQIDLGELENTRDFKNHGLGSLKIFKFDKASFEKLENATFTLYDTLTNKVVKDNLTTNANGEIEVDGLTTGAYYLKENKAPTGYILNKDKIDFMILENHESAKEVSLRIPNTKIKGNVKLLKTDKDNNKLKDAVFSLYQASNDKLIHKNYRTDENGLLEINNIEYGDYYFKETQAPEGYEIEGDGVYKFSINEQTYQEVITLTALNKKINHYAKIVKVDKEDNTVKIPGTKFKLFKDDGSLIDEYTTDDQGIIQVSDLEVGNYYFMESQAAPGYDNLAPDTKFPFTLSNEDNEKFITFTIENAKDKGAVILNKKDDQNKVLSGVKFNLFHEGDTSPVNTTPYETDNNGQIIINNLDPGDYYFLEVEGLDGYVSDLTTKHSFTIKANQESNIQFETVNITNNHAIGSFELFKSDDSNNHNPLEGVEYTLFDQDYHVYQTKLKTDQNGLLKINNLPFQKYYLMETKAKPGYILDTKPLEFSINEDNYQEVFKIHHTNKKILGKFKFTKLDGIETNINLAGATFHLFYHNGDKYVAYDTKEYKTKEDGTLNIDNLPYGKYQLLETKAPEGYVGIGKQVFFEVNQYSNLVSPNINVYNNHIKGSVTIVKKDATTKTNLKDAVFALYKADKNNQEQPKTTPYASNIITDKNGRASVNELDEGTYYFVETKAPLGYKLDSTPQKVVVDYAQGYETTIEMVNESLKASVTLIKKDTENNLLQDIEFSLYKVNDQEQLIAKELNTNKNGEIKVDNLDFGKYYFIETKTTNNYKLNKQKLNFEINEKNYNKPKELTFEMINEFKLGSIKLLKHDAKDSNKYLANAKFSLYTQDNKLIKDNLTSNKEGIIKVDKLKLGNYYFVETKAPNNYVLDNTQHHFTIDTSNYQKQITLKISNKSIEQVKKEQKKKLPKTGVVFQVTSIIVLLVISSLILLKKHYL